MHKYFMLPVRLCFGIALATLLLTLLSAAQVQAPETAAKGQQNPLPINTTPAISQDGDSVISADDVVDVYVMDVPELSRQYRVGPAGKITIPLLPNPISAGGMTLNEFSATLGEQLRKDGLVTDPHIVVTIMSSRLKSVAITGAVKMPQIYPVFGKTTLLDVLSQAQGLSDDASNVAVVSRGAIGEHATGKATQTVDLKKLHQGAGPEFNLAIYPGDRVTIPRAGVVYVVGAVNKPGGFVIRAADDGMSVLQALALAENMTATAVPSKSMIIRPDPASPDGHKQISLNVKQVLAAKEHDPMLRPDDVLFIPDSPAKKALRRGAEAALQAATYLAIYARP
jgi:polysaccharide biosynthesis/export protein